MVDNSNQSLIEKYNALIALKDADENRLERITKLLEILSIEIGTSASVKASAFTDEINPHFEAFKIKMAELKPQLEALKDNVKAKATAAKAAATTTMTRANGYGSGVVSMVSSLLGKTPAKGGKRIAHAASASAYKSTGDKVRLLINNKRLHRSIYVKGKAKYCKINNEFILLSKFKNKIID